VWRSAKVYRTRSHLRLTKTSEVMMKISTYQHGVPTNVCRCLSLVISPPDAMKALTPKSAICTLPSVPKRIFPALISLDTQNDRKQKLKLPRTDEYAHLNESNRGLSSPPVERWQWPLRPERHSDNYLVASCIGSHRVTNLDEYQRVLTAD
jgi:hypothetical protein